MSVAPLGWTIAQRNDATPVPDGERAFLCGGRDPDALILAQDGDQLVGSVIAGWDGWRCHVYRLAVAPGRRRQGIASGLVRRAEDRFQAFGGRRSDAMVLAGNAEAHPLWAAAGYRSQPEWARWVKPLRAQPVDARDPAGPPGPVR